MINKYLKTQHIPVGVIGMLLFCLFLLLRVGQLTLTMNWIPGTIVPENTDLQSFLFWTSLCAMVVGLFDKSK